MTALLSQHQEAASGDGQPIHRGLLHIYVAFDWGDEINLELARKLVPAEVHALPRRRRTPSSFSYRPAPLHFGIGPISLELAELGSVAAPGRLTVFDFAAVSVALRIPFALSAGSLTRLAGTLAEPRLLIQAARSGLQPLFQQLRPAIQGVNWQEDLSEEYFVFQLPPGEPLPPPEQLVDVNRGKPADWIASLVHLESGVLSSPEIAEALRLHLRYSPEDLFVPDWAAAVLIDRDCDETLDAIEFANLQLLEFRHIDSRLDANLAAAYRLIHPLTRSWMPFWHSQSRPLRVLGELKVEANDLFERIGNVLKLVGDPYLARVYRLVASRFYLEAWERSILRKLEVAERVYQVLADQAGALRTEVLEVLVVLLILLELVLAFYRH
jgi:hypothetical protein